MNSTVHLTEEQTPKADRILAKASRLFSLHGVEAVSMRDIAVGCGITMAALYYHFKSKEELYEEVSELKYEEFISEVRIQYEALPKAQRSPSALMALIFDAVLRDPTLFYLIQRDLLHFDKDVRHANSRKRYGHFLSLIEKSLREHWRGAVNDSHTFALASIITGYCELVHADARFVSPQRDEFVRQQRQGLVALVRQAFGSPFQ